MTAFNNTQPDKERHHLPHTVEADEEESLSSDVSQPWDSGASLLDAQKKLNFCKGSCNEEGCRSVEGKDNFSVLCCHCFERLPESLVSKQEVLCFLNRELEQERIAAESAANEAISMILRLQVEKAALQMEARHYQQVLEAKTLYDEETISQLQAIISSQEADRLVLEREIDECRQTLHKYSEIVMENGCSEWEDVSKDLARAATVHTCTQKTLSRRPSLGNGGILRPLSLEEKFNHVAMQTMEDAQQLEFSLVETKDEAKTKYVVSISSSDPNPTLNVDSGNSAPVMTSSAYLRMHDCQNGSLELEGVNVDSEGKRFNDVVKDCWLSILMQLSKLYKQIEALGISGFEDDCRLAKCQECSSDSRNGITQMQQKFPVDREKYGGECADCSPDAFQKEECILSQNMSPQNLECGVETLPRMLDLCWDNNKCKPLYQRAKVGDAHMDSWCEIMAITDGCITSLAEKFATCQSRFHALEVTRRAMPEALEIRKENMRKADKVLVIAADRMRDFLSFTDLGCDILDLLCTLITHLTTLVKLVDDAKYRETDWSSKINTSVMKQDDTLAADGKKPEILIQGDSDLLQDTDCKMSKLAFLWSSSLEWMSNEKCRAETAFSGWDHI